MPLTPLTFRPGINREITSFANEGGWWDCDKIRFRNGYPETIGGWTSFTSSSLNGVARSLLPFVDLTGKEYVAAGTGSKYYVVNGGVPSDITPIRETTAAGDITVSATTGSSVVTVSDTGHGATAGAYVTFSGLTALGGDITALILNAEHVVVSVVNANVYTIDVTTLATAGDTGNGGASGVGAYQINPGTNSAVFGTGWGTGPWSRGTWGSSFSSGSATSALQIWSQDTFGEDLLFNNRGGNIYLWDATNPSDRAVALEDLAGAQSAPTVASRVLVSERDRHTIAFGCDPELDPGVQDPLIIRFANQESYTEWRTLETTTAGELRISQGTKIVTAVQTKQQILVLTDVSAHAMQYIGAPLTFGLTELSANISVAGPNVAVPAGDVVYWMGRNEFYSYAGQVMQVDCTVKDYVFSDINRQQIEKIVGGHNAAFGEVWWFYPSASSEENNRYVVYNYMQDVWYYGALNRSAWVDRGVFPYPLAVDSSGNMYTHEFGISDGSENPPTGIGAFIQSSPMDMGDGDKYMFGRRLIPDITFRSSTGSPSATFTIQALNFPGGLPFGDYPTDGMRTSTVPVEQYTRQTFVRIRGRAMSIRVESDETNTSWRLGIPRLELRTDGRK